MRDIPQAVMQLAEMDKTVLIRALIAIAPLKEGQYTHRKIVPTMAIS